MDLNKVLKVQKTSTINMSQMILLFSVIESKSESKLQGNENRNKYDR